MHFTIHANKDLLSMANSPVVRFLIVGLFCASVEYITFHVSIRTFEIGYLEANVLSLVIAIIINYSLSRTFVFAKSKYSKRVEFLSFIFFSILAISLNQYILWLLFKVLENDIRASKLIAIVFVAVFNYLTKKYLVFKA